MAAALGVSVDSFYILPEQHMFHVEADGTRWLLTSTAPGQPVIRCLQSGNSGATPGDQSVAAFLIDNLERPQGAALAKLIDRVLAMHLHLSVREQDLAVATPTAPGCRPLS
jgi:hypothetical protein